MIRQQHISLRFRAACASILTLIVFFSDDLSIVAFNQANSGIYAEIWQQDTQAWTNIWRSKSLLGQALPQVASASAALVLGEYQLFSGLTVKQQQKNALSLLIEWQEGELNKQFIIVVANDAAPYIQRQSEFKQRLLFWMSIFGLILLLLQLALFKWLFQPLKQVNQELSNIQTGEQTEFSDSYPAEVKTLTASLNLFLASERSHIQKVRQSLANLAHSLKTPLAVIQTELSNSEIDKEIVTENVDRINRAIDYQLNKASSVVKPSFRRSQDCLASFQRIIKALQQLYANQGIKIDSDFSDAKNLRFYGDLDDLSEIVGNLSENACKWANSKVLIKAWNESVGDHKKHENAQQKLMIQIIDDGPGIASEDIEKVSKRGQRLDQSIEGQGIGLAVVHELVESYQGTIEFLPSKQVSANFDSGLAVEVKI